MLCHGFKKKKQEVVAPSLTEAEHIAMSSACCQGIWFKLLLNDCGVTKEGAIPICCDNRSSIAVGKNPECMVELSTSM